MLDHRSGLGKIGHVLAQPCEERAHVPRLERDRGAQRVVKPLPGQKASYRAACEPPAWDVGGKPAVLSAPQQQGPHQPLNVNPATGAWAAVAAGPACCCEGAGDASCCLLLRVAGSNPIGPMQAEQ